MPATAVTDMSMDTLQNGAICPLESHMITGMMEILCIPPESHRDGKQMLWDFDKEVKNGK